MCEPHFYIKIRAQKTPVDIIEIFERMGEDGRKVFYDANDNKYTARKNKSGTFTIKRKVKPQETEVMIPKEGIAGVGIQDIIRLFQIDE